MRSLVIGEDFPIRELVTAMLEPFGPCEATSSPSEALELFTTALANREAFELIVCDVLPIRKGRRRDMLHTVCAMRVLEEKSPRVPTGRARLLLLAAFRDPESVRILQGLPPAEFLRKPFDEESLLLALKRLGLP